MQNSECRMQTEPPNSAFCILNSTTGCTIDAQVRNLCTPKPDSLASWNPLEQASPFVTGKRTSLGLSIAGGGEVANYFVSGDIDRDWGVLEPNKFKRVGLRANLNGQVGSDLSLQVATNYVSSRLEFPQNDNNVLGVLGGALLGSAFDNPTSRGWLSGQTPQEVYALDVKEDIQRFLGSLSANWQAVSWLTMVGTTGVDYFSRRNKQTVPPNEVFFGSLPEGQRQANVTDVWNYTANGSATANFELNPTVHSTTTLGVQFTQETVQGNRAFGAKLLAGTGSLQGTAARFGVGEANTDNKTLGALLQQQIGWRDRLFATAAVRTDNNSAFGKNFGWITYPAFSLSYVISEEPFFPQGDVLSSLRLRAAYGQSGQRPNFRDAITFFNTQTITASGTDFAGVTVEERGIPTSGRSCRLSTSSASSRHCSATASDWSSRTTTRRPRTYSCSGHCRRHSDSRKRSSPILARRRTRASRAVSTPESSRSATRASRSRRSARRTRTASSVSGTCRAATDSADRNQSAAPRRGLPVGWVLGRGVHVPGSEQRRDHHSRQLPRSTGRRRRTGV